jgi:hypothetical protein
MKKIKFYILFFVFCAFATAFISVNFINSVNAAAAPAPVSASLLQSLNPAKKHNYNKDKTYGAYILNKQTVLKLDKNYGLKAYVTESIKILSQRGINKYSEVILPFSTKYQKIKLLYAYTLLKGMFKVPAGKHAVNVVSPGFAVNYPAYSDIKYLTISMPAVEDGSIINFSYEINYFKPIIKKGVFYTNYFSFTVPAKKIGFTIVYPAGLNLNVYLHKLNKHIISKKILFIKNQKYFKLGASIKNIKAVKKESYMPPIKNLRKYIALSTYTSWSALLSNINKSFIKSEKQPSENIKKFVESAVKQIGHGRSNKKEAAVSIYKRFVKSFRYEGIGYGINGYDPEPVSPVFSDGYGDSKSLAALLISMLKIEKINAYPVLVSSLNTSDLNVKSVSPKQFDAVIVGMTIREKGKRARYFLYPDSSSYKAFKIPFSLAGRKGIFLLSGNRFKFIIIPSERPEQNEKIFKFNGTLYKNGYLKGTVSVGYKGIYSNFERSSLKSVGNYAKKNKAIDFLYDFLPGASVKNFNYENIKNINGNIKLKIKFSDKNYGVLNGDKLVFHSVLPIDTGLIHLILKQKRRYPLIIGYPFEHIAAIKIKLPEKSNIYFLPPAIKLNNEQVSAYSNCSFSKSKETLKCFYKLVSKEPAVSISNYRKFRSVITRYIEYLKNYFIVDSSVYFY